MTPIWRHRTPIQAALIFLVSVFGFALFLNVTINIYDEGITLMGAERIAHGQMPYRDFYTLYGPGYVALLACLFEVFGHSILVERICDMLFRAGNVTLVFLIVARAGSFPAAWLAAAASLMALGASMTPGYIMIPTLCLTLGSVLCLWPVLEGTTVTQAPRRLFAAGLCTGGVVLCRYDVGGVLLVMQAVCLGTQAGLGTGSAHAPMATRTRLAACRAAPLLAGALVLLLPYVAAVVASGATGDLVSQVVVLTMHSYAAMRSLPLPGLHALRRNPGITLVYMPALVLVITAWFVVADRVRRPRPAPAPWPVIMVAATMLVFIGKAYVRISIIHMQAAIVMALALLGILWPGARAWQRPSLATVAAATLWCLTLFLPQEWREMRDGFAWWRGPGPCATADIPRLSCIPFDAPHVAAIRLIQRTTERGQPVFVSAGRHDKIFANDMVLPFLADRPSATKWQQMDPGLQTTLPIQQQIVAELARRCPTYAVLETQWDAMHEPNGSSVSSGVTLLDDELRRGFRHVATFGTVGVFRNMAPCAQGVPAAVREGRALP
jgi:hypothetical protein